MFPWGSPELIFTQCGVSLPENKDTQKKVRPERGETESANIQTLNAVCQTGPIHRLLSYLRQ